MIDVILGIETSCDETAAGIVDANGCLRANVVASQAEIHSEYGGIVPEVASRQHIRDIAAVVDTALRDAECGWDDIDVVAATNGPGLAGSLLVGVNFAKGAAAASGLPFITVNHLVGHVMAAFIDLRDASSNGNPGAHVDVQEDVRASSRYMALIVSGGHTELVVMEGSLDAGFEFRLIGETRDDAAGEAFDKAARVLGLGFPGGPAIQAMSERPHAETKRFPRPSIKGSLDFSFSGLKTAMLHRAQEKGWYPPSDVRVNQRELAGVAAAFQEAMVDCMVTRCNSAAKTHRVKGILLGGGVAANSLLRREMTQASPVPVIVPRPSLCTDNGAMIGAAAWRHLRSGPQYQWDLDVAPSLRLA